MTYFISPQVFQRYSVAYQHKKASQLLEKALTGHRASLHDYRYVEGWLNLASIDLVDSKKVKDRLHLHREKAGITLHEHHYEVTHFDAASEEAFLPIAIYLDNLRSAFNVGSILRTTEALRLGSLHFAENTPFIDNPKVQKTAMGTDAKVPSFQHTPLSSLPKPIIGLETVRGAPSIYDFSFPASFTLILGNEEYGLSDASLKACDHFVQIPLYGFKNSLNVASAFTAVASEIRRQRSLLGITCLK